MGETRARYPRTIKRGLCILKSYLERVEIPSFVWDGKVGHSLCILHGSKFANLGKRFDDVFRDDTRDFCTVSAVSLRPRNIECDL